ncbi:MAG: hypothetical protein PHX27_03115 [Candidatus ainarchaeum sp.]|nr:hypothetical protein [Candidatus ainarchaeum sp.]
MSHLEIINFKKKKVLGVRPKCFLITEINFDVNNKKPIDFCILLIFYKKEKVYEIIKFDGKHSFCHVHKYFEQLNDKGQNCLPSQINSTSIQIFKTDVLSNWKEYLKQYRKKYKI